MRHDPAFHHLLYYMADLPSLYANERSYFDKKRFCSFFRSPTQTPERYHDALFIKKIAQWIDVHRFIYIDIDPFIINAYEHPSYSEHIEPILKLALTGAMLLILLKIKNAYTNAILPFNEASLIQRSALAKILLSHLYLSKLSDMEVRVYELRLVGLKHFIQAIDTHNQTQIEPEMITWHPLLSNDEMIHLIDLELNKLPIWKQHVQTLGVNPTISA